MHFYRCRTASLGQEIEINIAVRNSDKAVRRRDRRSGEEQGSWQSARVLPGLEQLQGL